MNLWTKIEAYIQAKLQEALPELAEMRGRICDLQHDRDNLFEELNKLRDVVNEQKKHIADLKEAMEDVPSTDGLVNEVERRVDDALKALDIEDMVEKAVENHDISDDVSSEVRSIFRGIMDNI